MCAVLFAVLALTVAGCAPGAISANGAQVPSAFAKPTSYQISDGDKLDIKVFSEPEMSGEVQVDGEGAISLPLVGRMQAAGLTAAALRQRITQQLVAKGLVQDPNVTVAMLSYEPFNIFGEVRNAGQYTYRPGMTVRDAIALAGGYTYRANKNYIYIQHQDGNGEEKLSMAGAQLYVQPGDAVRVPERYF
jgi:protein involved in polysaccharide export with SLBB domain